MPDEQGSDDPGRKSGRDELTGLPNRLAFIGDLEAALGAGVKGTVGYLDVDRFKVINDRLGHAAGDAVLKIVVQRVAQCLGKGAKLARAGGDEFYLFLPELGLADAHRKLGACLAEVAKPIDVRAQLGVAHPVGRQTINVTLSIGIAIANGRALEMTLRESDMALFTAKRLGGNRVVAFAEDLPDFLSRTTAEARDLERLALENRRLYDEARTDALTGLRNPRALAELEQRTLGSDGSPWVMAAVVFLDIDCFGKYNHLYGDSAGDAVLRAVAHALVHAARGADLVFRKGGEEFVVVLPEVDAAGAVIAAERIRGAIESLGIAHADSDASNVVTVTVGVSCGAAGERLGGVRAIAGDLVMAAKRAGRRNEVHCPPGGR